MITKLMVFVLIFAILNIIKEGFSFYKSLRVGESNMTKTRMWGLGLSIAYILTIIFTGMTW